MAARHLDEGLLGWLLLTTALAGGLSAIGAVSYYGARRGISRGIRAIADAHVSPDSAHD